MAHALVHSARAENERALFIDVFGSARAIVGMHSVLADDGVQRVLLFLLLAVQSRAHTAERSGVGFGLFGFGQRANGLLHVGQTELVGECILVEVGEIAHRDVVVVCIVVVRARN